MGLDRRARVQIVSAPAHAGDHCFVSRRSLTKSEIARHFNGDSLFRDGHPSAMAPHERCGVQGAGCGVGRASAVPPTRSAHTPPGLHVDAEEASLLFEVAHGHVVSGDQVAHGLDAEGDMSLVSPSGQALARPREALRGVDG